MPNNHDLKKNSSHFHGIRHFLQIRQDPGSLLLANGARISPEIPHVPGIGITPYNILIIVVSDILMDPVFGEILQEFSIEQRFGV